MLKLAGRKLGQVIHPLLLHDTSVPHGITSGDLYSLCIARFDPFLWSKRVTGIGVVPSVVCSQCTHFWLVHSPLKNFVLRIDTAELYSFQSL